MLLGGLIWYLFIKPYDYRVTFTAKALPGAVEQTLKLWTASLKKATPVVREGPYHFKSQVQYHDSVFAYEWQIERLNDSVSKVFVYVTDKKHSLHNKLTIPFFDTDFEKRTKSSITEAIEVLQEHIEQFKVTIVGVEDFKSKYCACVPVNGSQLRKGSGMMVNYPFLSDLIGQSNAQLDGTPIIEVTDWNREKDSLAYNFCFPVIKSDSLPQNTKLVYKRLPRKKALKAIYNGSYITSDRAWYALLDYAKKHNINVVEKPLEIFKNNPNMGGNPLKLEAEVFMPIRE